MYRNYLRHKTNKNEVIYQDFKYAVICNKIALLLQSTNEERLAIRRMIGS